MNQAFALLTVFVSLAAGCETTADTTSLETSASAITSIFVDPSFFMGDLPCGPSEGAMQSYVAHLYDVTNQLAVALPASPPISCSASVTFRQVVYGRKYRIKIDGYKQAPSQLYPVGGMTSGSHTMIAIGDKDKPDAQPILPQWTTHCADVASQEDVRVSAASCEALAATSINTGIAVDPRVAMKSAVPALTCNEVRALSVRPDDPSLSPITNWECTEGGPGLPPYVGVVTPGQTYTFRIEGHAVVGGPAVWGSSCFATSKEGLITTAICDPLRSDGAMDVMIAGLLGPETCSDANVVTYDVVAQGPPKESVQAVACEKPVRFSPLVPGKHNATVVGYGATGNVVFTAECLADVEPGKVSAATCSVLP